jgi:TfoX/Sxy family transcriptional regulator of competence genes
MPKAGDAAKAAFRALLPVDADVTVRPMFGNVAAFVNGNMFAGLFGDDIFVRLPDDEQEQVVAAGGRVFEPMPGRAMKGYVIVPSGGSGTAMSQRSWIDRSLSWSRRLPAKEAKPKRR